MALVTTTLGQKLPDPLTVEEFSTVQENENKRILEQGILDLRKLLEQTQTALAAAAVPVGVVQAFDGVAAPSGYLLCQGQSLLRSLYPDLFAVVGVKHGAADVTHFNVPNYKGRTLVGFDSTQTEFNTVGKVSGTKSTNHSSYSPGINSGNYQAGGSNHTAQTITQMNNFLVAGGSSTIAQQATVQNVGTSFIVASGGAAIEVRSLNYTSTNIQPSATVQYIIKT
jgi:microcystin-dependent protein